MGYVARALRADRAIEERLPRGGSSDSERRVGHARSERTLLAALLLLNSRDVRLSRPRRWQRRHGGLRHHTAVLLALTEAGLRLGGVSPACRAPVA